MKKKYGVTVRCKHCNKEFITRPRYVLYCSTPCKNPINRPGHTAWNKGVKLTEEQKAKMNMNGLKKGWGWNKGMPLAEWNPKQAENHHWNGDKNPNWDGKLNDARPKNPVDDAFRNYKAQCWRVTRRSCYAMRKEGLVPENTGKRPEDLQLDHIIPFRQGYEAGIPPEVIGGRCNLQYITGYENRRKWDTPVDKETVINIIKEHEKWDIQLR